MTFPAYHIGMAGLHYKTLRPSRTGVDNRAWAGPPVNTLSCALSRDPDPISVSRAPDLLLTGSVTNFLEAVSKADGSLRRLADTHSHEGLR